jgi:3-deoxy-7-phosphoheptulonate synthase
MKNSDDIKKLVKGLMIESYIEEGSQKIEKVFMENQLLTPVLDGTIQKN